MKRLLLWVAPLLVAIPVFIGTVAFLNQKTGNGALQVTSIPDSSVYLDGKLIGKTPLCKCEAADMIAVGDHVVKLVPSSGDFMPFEGKITIYKSVLTVLDRTFGNGPTSAGSIITLTPIEDKNAAQFFAISFPDKAQVLLDGSPAGETALLLPNITASDHELTFRKEGYREKVVRVRAVKGYKLSATVYLGISDEIASPSAVASPSAAPNIAKVLILATPTGFLNVRSSASLSGSVLQRVYPGDTFELVSEQTGWYEIKLNPSASSGVETGWISSQYASKQ